MNLYDVLTHYNRLCKIWDFYSGDYEECHLLGYDAMCFLQEPMFRRSVSPQSSGWKESAD
jgi:hypothetical protein